MARMVGIIAKSNVSKVFCENIIKTGGGNFQTHANESIEQYYESQRINKIEYSRLIIFENIITNLSEAEWHYLINNICTVNTKTEYVFMCRANENNESSFAVNLANTFTQPNHIIFKKSNANLTFISCISIEPLDALRSTFSADVVKYIPPVTDDKTTISDDKDNIPQSFKQSDVPNALKAYKKRQQMIAVEQTKKQKKPLLGFIGKKAPASIPVEIPYTVKIIIDNEERLDVFYQKSFNLDIRRVKRPV
jgi:hypothetical protein